MLSHSEQRAPPPANISTTLRLSGARTGRRTVRHGLDALNARSFRALHVVALGAFNPDDLTALSGEAPRFLSAGEQK